MTDKDSNKNKNENKQTKAKNSKNEKKNVVLKDEHPNYDFFVADIINICPKDDIASMGNPIFSLSKKTDLEQVEYKNKKGEYIKITPTKYGRATIYDKDILIYCISQLVEAANNERKIEKNITIKAFDLLKATNRATSGKGYDDLNNALRRLQTTSLETSLMTGGKCITSGFSLIQSWETVKKTPEGQMEAIRITLSDWLYNSITSNEVLKISNDYFKLTKSLDRRMYEIARKHLGVKKRFKIHYKTLFDKSGSTGQLRRFKLYIRELTETNHIPDFWFKQEENIDDITHEILPWNGHILIYHKR